MALQNGGFSRWQKSRPVLLKPRSSRWFITMSVSIAVFTDIFLYGLVVPVLPFALQSRAGVAQEDIQKWVTVSLVVYAAFLLAFSPITGWAADKTKTRRMPLLLSLLAFAGSTLLLMLGRSIGAIIAGRALQGISAAAVWSIGLALLVDTTGTQELGEAMGYVSLSMSLAIFCAPLLGGVVYQKAGYYAVFYMAFGVIALDIVLRMLIIEKHQAKYWHSLSVTDPEKPESVTQSIQPPEITAATVMAGDKALESDSRPQGTTMLEEKGLGENATNKKAQGQAPGIETRLQDTKNTQNDPQDNPHGPKERKKFTSRLPPMLQLLASKRLLAALWGQLAVSTIMTSFDAVLPIYVSEIFHWNSIGAGLIFLALIVPSALNPLVGKIADRSGARYLTAFGFLLNVPLLVCLRFVDHNTINQKVLLCALLAMLGFALSVILIPLLAEVTWAVEAKVNRSGQTFGKNGAYAQGYGLMNASFAAGTLIGPLWSGFVKEQEGWATAMWTLALFSGVTAILEFLFLEGWVGRSKSQNVSQNV